MTRQVTVFDCFPFFFFFSEKETTPRELFKFPSKLLGPFLKVIEHPVYILAVKFSIEANVQER